MHIFDLNFDLFKVCSVELMGMLHSSMKKPPKKSVRGRLLVLVVLNILTVHYQHIIQQWKNPNEMQSF